MQESDTYLMILDEGQEKRAKKDILLIGEDRIGPPDESIKTQLESITDLDRLDRMVRRALKALTWQEILDQRQTSLEPPLLFPRAARQPDDVGGDSQPLIEVLGRPQGQVAAHQHRRQSGVIANCL